MSIVTAVARLDHPHEGSANGVVRLKFENLGAEKVVINCWTPYGSGGFDDPARKGLPVFDFKGREPYEIGYSFARVSYVWTDVKGKTVIDGKYDPDEQNLTVNPGEHSVLLVPVNMPFAPGRYVLHVLFDNQHLKSAEKSIGNRYAFNADADKFVHLRLSAHRPVTVSR